MFKLGRKIGSAFLAMTFVACALAQDAPKSEKAAIEKTPAEKAVLDPSSAEFANQYAVGESDALRITVWREAELSQNVVVRPDGKISLPLLKDVAVAGLTPTQIEKMISEQLKTYVTNPQVTVTVQEIRSKRAYVTGEVAHPGPYPLLAPTTVLQVLAQAGGFTAFAKRNKIVILRDEGGKQVRLPFDYSKVVKGHNSEQNLLLRSGDTVVVP